MIKILIYLLFFSSTCYANTRDGLVYWFKLDEGSGTSTVSSSSTANTGTLTNSPTWTTGCARGTCLKFAGNTFVSFPTSPSQDGPLSISAWINSSNLTADTFGGRILSNRNTTGWTTFTSTTANQNLVFFHDCSVTNMSRRGGTVPLNQNNHVVFTWDGSTSASNIHIYLNGSEVSTYGLSQDCVGTLVGAAGTLSIANTVIAQDADFTGTIDDVRLYNRVITAQEIKDLYNSGISLKGTGTTIKGTGTKLNY